MSDTYTSESHPIKIAEVPCSNGILGLTFCPGKHAKSAFGHRWERDLEADLDAIREWEASRVVSVMEAFEFGAFNVSMLPEMVEKRGMAWHHLPVVDGGVPLDSFETLWTYHGHALRQSLDRGEKVLIHCRGGLGRTGTIAARLLIEFGAEAEAAIGMVRSARPGAIENAEQESYVRSQREIQFDPETLDLLLGVLLGGAVGDAFGYAVEFSNWPTIQRRFGPAGLRAPLFDDDGYLIATDDTQMTLFTTEGLLDSLAATEMRLSLGSYIRLAYRRWYSTQFDHGVIHGEDGLLAFPQMWERRAPGNTCLDAMRRGGKGSIKKPLNNSKGCGGVMRVAPLALWPHFGLEKVVLVAADAAAATHGHPSGYWSAGFLAGVVYGVSRGSDLKDAIRTTGEILKGKVGADETLAAVSSAVMLASSGAPVTPEQLVAALGLGWVGEEALAIAIYSALTAESFEELMIVSANHSGDSDSTASIAGQIWGAQYGLKGIPNAWVRRLDLLEPCCWIARRAFEVTAA